MVHPVKKNSMPHLIIFILYTYIFGCLDELPYTVKTYECNDDENNISKQKLI